MWGRILSIARQFFWLGVQYWWHDYGRFKKDEDEKQFYKQLVSRFELMGPCFIKLGQWMAMRPDLFSEHMSNYGKALHMSCKEHNFKETKRIFYEEFQQTIHDAFDEIEEKPVASGAIGQVYRAKVKYHDYEDDVEKTKTLAVKVMHPWVEKDIFSDLQIMNFVSQILGRFPHFKNAKIIQAIKEFKDAMQNQLDFELESKNLERFQKSFDEWDGIVFPQVEKTLTSKRVITMTFEEGDNINDAIDDKSHVKYSQSMKDGIATAVIFAFFKMVLKDRFLHVDLHPGNMLIQSMGEPTDQKVYNETTRKVEIKSVYNPRIVILDCGLSYSIIERDGKQMEDLFCAFKDCEYPKVVEILWVHSNRKHLENGDELKKLFQEKFEQHFEKIREKPLSEIELGPFFNDSMKIMHEFGISFEPNFANLLISLIIIEGFVKQMNLDLNIVNFAVEFEMVHRKWLKKKQQ